MAEKTIQWFKNNWFLWVILILAYVTIRATGYDIKVEKKSDEIDWTKYNPAKKGKYD